MPCLNPIHISAPSHTFANWANIPVDKDSFFHAYDVPCGKCEWCLQQKKSSYYLRCLHEYNRCNLQALFVTLTYDDKHLPTTENLISNPVFIPCEPDLFNSDAEFLLAPVFKSTSHWYKPHVQDFLKKLNEKLIYFIGTNILGLKRLAKLNGHRCITPEWHEYLSKSCRPLKYFVTCERGKADTYISDSGRIRTGTARPHYHAILFLSDIRLYNHINTIINFIKELWVYGLTYSVSISNPSNPSTNPDRTPEQCINYVTKYVCKDISDSSLGTCFSDYKTKRDCEPFVLISKFLGSSLLDNMFDDAILSFIKDGYTMTSKGKSFTVNIPQYNIRRKTLIPHRIPCPKGYIFRNFRNNPDLDTYYLPGFGFYSLTPDDLALISDSNPKPDSVTIYEKTPLWYKLNKETRNRKAQYYSDLLLYLQTNPSIYLWNQSDCPLSNRNVINDYQIIHDTSSDDLYQFILDSLYVDCDNSKYPDSLFQCYEILSMYLSSLTKYSISHHDVNYKLKLTESITNSPHLFEFYPL